MRGSKRRWRWGLLSALAVALGAGLAFPYTVDDAYIVGRYARHLAQLGHYGMNASGLPSDGVTGPLWLLPGVLAVWVGLDPVVVAKVGGTLCACLAAALWMSDLRGRRHGALAAPVALGVLALQPSYATWAAAGLETGAAALGLALCARGPACVRGSSAAAVAFLRPELWPAAMVMLLAGPRPAPALSFALGGLGPLAAVAFRFALFGDFLPLSVRAKPAMLGVGLEYGLRGALLVTGGFGLLALWMGARHGRRRDRVVAVAWLVGLLSIVVAGGDWMPGFRLFGPLLPPYAVLVGTGVAALQRARGWPVAGPALALTVALPVADLVLRIPEQRRSAQSRARVGAAMARRVASVPGPLATVDVGYVPYVSGVEVIDLGGVTDPAIGRLPGPHLAKRLPEDWLAERRPGQLLLHSRRPPVVDREHRLRAFDGYPVERRVARMALIRNGFLVKEVFTYGPQYHYVWLVPACVGAQCD